MSKIEIPRRLFITGTDTAVGKTFISAVLMAGLKGIYWKPVQSGTGDGTDTEWVRQATGLPEVHFLPETYRLKRPLSPHASAGMEGVRIKLDAFRVPETKGYLIVEGVGGIMVPLNDHHFMLDLMKKLDFPVLLVARRTLGTINHTLLSLEQLRRYGLEVFGVVMNGPGDQIPLHPPLAKGERSRGFPPEFTPHLIRGGNDMMSYGNREAIEFYGKVKVLAEIEPLPAINPKSLAQAFERYFGEGLEHG